MVPSQRNPILSRRKRPGCAQVRNFGMSANDQPRNPLYHRSTAPVWFLPNQKSS